MLTVESLMGLLANYATANLACSVVKGRPAWGRTSLTPPVAALLLEEADFSAAPSRVGGAGLPLIADLTVFARNEQALWTMCDTVHAWIPRSGVRADVDGHTVELRIVSASRHEPITDAEQESYGFLFRVQITTK